MASDGSATSSRRPALVAAGSLVGGGVALGAVLFPVLFNQWLARDDEGVFVFALREFLNNKGALYSKVWTDMYGPFYYLTMSTVYRVIHQQPTLENGRWLLLILTAASAALFGASVWRVTKSIPASLVCETASFLILIAVAGYEPMHPGSLGVFLVSVVAFEFASYAATRRTAHLVAIGVATGALTMTKVNAGGLVAAAVAFAFVVGNRRSPQWLQLVVGGLAALLPVVLMSQKISNPWVGMLAFVVIMAIVGMFVLMRIDDVSLPAWPLLPIAAGAAAAIVGSLAFPVLTGTKVGDEIQGVFIRPLTLPGAFTVPGTIDIQWLTVILALGGVFAAVAFQSRSNEPTPAMSGWMHVTLAAFALWLLVPFPVLLPNGWVFAKWLPGIVLLVALAMCIDTSESIRLALRSTVLLAVLGILIVYPVAGSQVGWGTVAMVVPCAIALAVGVDHSRVWRESGLLMRGGAVLVLCSGLIVMSSTWPPDIWRGYLDATPLNLPGAGLVRVDPDTAETVQEVTQALRAQCDTFYDIPDQNSFYIFSGLPAVTGMLANGGPAGLTVQQQGKVADELQAASATQQRVCIMRDTSQNIVLPFGTLTDVLNQYTTVVASVGSYTISRHN